MILLLNLGFSIITSLEGIFKNDGTLMRSITCTVRVKESI